MANPDQNTPSHEVTRILHAVQRGDESSTDELIPLVYQELRRLAAYKLAHEVPGQTLQPTALVHEAYLRLVKPGGDNWDSRRHFFCAAAEAMRRILIENARRKKTIRHGGDLTRTLSDPDDVVVESPPVDLIDLSEALEEFSAVDADTAELVRLRYFAGLNFNQIAPILGISLRTVTSRWTYAKAWLCRRLDESQ